AVFRGAMERCAAAWKEETGESLIAELYPEAGEPSRMEQARVAQPALFAVEYALAELWRSWGVEPSVLLGHSLGEYVAAVVAGVFRMEDGLRLVCARARLMDTLSQRGAMRSIAATPERVQQELRGVEKEVSIAVINGPENVVISGASEAVEKIAAKLEAEGIRTRALQVTHAFHSPLLEPILDEFEQCAREIKYAAPRIRIISNLTGEAARAEEITTPRYWREHMRGTVRFHAGLQTALATGCASFIEIGPQPHLKALVTRTDESLESRVQPSLRRQHSDWEQMLDSLARLYVQGHKIDWRGFDHGYARVRIALPTYPFERQRYWLASGDVAGLSQKIWRHSMAEALAQSKFAPIGMDLASFPAKWKTLERLTVAEILHTLRRLNGFVKPGTSHDAESLTASCGILPAHTKLVSRWLNLLADTGYLARDGGRFINRGLLPDVDLGNAWQEAELALSDDPYSLQYLRNCSKHIKGVLLGTTSPLETLFPRDSPRLARNLYGDTNGTRYINRIVAGAVEAACLAAPANGRLRILELGAGTGATTAAILPRLPGERVSYSFTDVSEVFLERASAEFSEYSFVRYDLLDIENQEHLAFHSGRYDIVIAANVVHATLDVPTTLTEIARLLAPGGTVVLVESTADFAWHDITIGLVRGWQKSEDPLRAGRTLLNANEWKIALQQAGFEEVLSSPEAASPAETFGLHVVMGWHPASAAGAGSEQTAHFAAAGSTWSPWKGVAPAVVSNTKALIMEAPAAERQGILLDAVCEEIARVLHLTGDAVPKKRDRLMDLGLDSLMAVELRNRLASSLGLNDLPATLIFDYPTPDAIAEYLLEQIQENSSAVDEAASVTASTSRAPVFSAEQVSDLSEEEIAALLRSQLAR
ncbi:MAG: acyltransferase domain-containing protein, partial [Acidobacteriaceae bacterium]